MTDYTIRQAAERSGLPASTLRYYETIGLIKPVGRDASSGHRVYTDADLHTLEAIACLNAVGFPIDEMRSYLQNRELGDDAATDQIHLLETQATRLEAEQAYLQVRHAYVLKKVEYWKARQAQDLELVARFAHEADDLVEHMRAVQLAREGRDTLQPIS